MQTYHVPAVYRWADEIDPARTAANMAAFVAVQLAPDTTVEVVTVTSPALEYHLRITTDRPRTEIEDAMVAADESETVIAYY